MSRKHARPPLDDWLVVAQAIRRRLNALLDEGHRIDAILMDGPTFELFRAAMGGRWSLSAPSLFDHPVERDHGAGWSVRVKHRA